MKPIYIDITNIPELDHYTGISRVVTELIQRLLADRMPLCLLSYSVPKGAYRIVDNDRFLLGARGLLDKQACYTDEYLAISDFAEGATFLDINSAWHTLPNRSYLLPQLKNKQIRIFVQIYDLIPIRYPQYMAGQTLLRFMEYLTAHLTYADAVLVNTHAVEQDVRQLFSELALPEKPIHIIPLGADFTAPENQQKGNDAADAELLQRLSGRRYLLTVGTVEPRKNHKVLIDAYEKRLADMGYDLVIVGRVGWEMEGLVSRIKSNRHFGNGLYLLSGINDATLDALIAAVTKYADAAVYSRERERIAKHYQPPQWADTAEAVKSLLDAKSEDAPYPHKPVKQVVFLSARPAPLLATLPFIEAFMPFITELVVCCPAQMADFLHEQYKGRLHLTTITDDALLAGRQLPPDHSTRNFFLRCLAMEQSAIDDEFIMCDDDYRPMHPLTEEVFYRDGKYIGYYFSDIAQWKFHITALFSYDFCHFRTLHFLRSHGYPTLQYSAHQPQLINKVWYRELLRQYPDIRVKGYDEWSTYFNYCAAVHADQYQPKPYVTLSWPPVGGENKGVTQPAYLFENYYAENYDAGRPFAGLSRAFTDPERVLRENRQKELAAIRAKVATETDKAFIDRYALEYEAQFGEMPQCAVYFGSEADAEPVLGVPCYIRLRRTGTNTIRMGISRAKRSAANILPALVELHITDADVNVLYRTTFDIGAQLCYTSLPFQLPEELPEDTPLFLRLAIKLGNRPQRTEQVIPIELAD